MNKSPRPITVKVHVAPLEHGVLEHIVWNEIRKLVSSGHEEAYLSVITHGKLYTVSRSVINKLSEHVDVGNERTIFITNDNEEGAKVIGRLTYRSLDMFFRNKGFITIASRVEKGKKVYYGPNDPTFTLEIKKKEATFRAIRGLMPKVYAGNIPGIVYLFFVPEGSHVIEVHDWKAFIGAEVKIMKAYLEELDRKNIRYSKVFMLEKVEEYDAIVNDLILNSRLRIPLTQIYIPAETKLLHNFGVLETLQAFTSFRQRNFINGEDTEYRFLERALEKILPSKDEFTLKIGLTDVIFRRVMFRLREGA